MPKLARSQMVGFWTEEAGGGLGDGLDGDRRGVEFAVAIVTVRSWWRRAATLRLLGIVSVGNVSGAPSIVIWVWERMASSGGAAAIGGADPQRECRVEKIGRVGLVDLVMDPAFEPLTGDGVLVAV